LFFLETIFQDSSAYALLEMTYPQILQFTKIYGESALNMHN